MERRFVVSQREVNLHNLVDAVAIQTLLRECAAQAILRHFGLTLEQIETQYQVQSYFVHVEVTLINPTTLQLGSNCTVETFLKVERSRLSFRHDLQDCGKAGLTGRQVINFVDRLSRQPTTVPLDLL